MDSRYNFAPNFPERLAKNLAETESVLSARTRSARARQPPTTMASETLASDVPQCPDGHVTKRLSYSNTPSETVLYSLKQHCANTVPRDEEFVIRDNFARRHPLQNRQMDTFAGKIVMPLQTRSERDERRLFLNGLDEDWGSDSSADPEVDTSSPSLRTRQQSITTAATSVDGTIGQGSKGGYGSIASSPKTFGPVSLTDEGSWVDLEPEILGLGSEGHQRHASGVTGTSSNSQHSEALEAAGPSKDDYCEQWQQQQTIRIPARRSSLSHQVTTAILGETAHSRKTSTNSIANGLLLQPLPPSSQASSSRYLPLLRRPQTSGTDREAVSEPEVFVNHRLPCSASSASTQPASRAVTDQLSLPSLFTKDDGPRDTASPSHHRKPSKPSSPHSIAAKMPGLTRVNTWLASGNGLQPVQAGFTASPSGLSPSHMRVSGDILENLRLIVNNFPNLPLDTSCLTIQTIRSYSRKLKRVDFERRAVRLPEEQALTFAECVTSPELSPLGRKGSMTALNIMNSLRGKFTNLYSNSGASRVSHDEDMLAWPPVDTRHITLACDSPPVRQNEDSLETCVSSLRAIFPNGSHYLLDLVYAHLTAYTYINSLIGGLAPVVQRNGAVLMHLRGKRSMNIPAGVTSLADLQIHPDSSETIIRDFHQNVALVTARDVIPPKAAATLGLGSTATSLSVKPVSGSRRPGSKDRFREVMSPSTAAIVQSLESDRALCELRDDISRNVYRLVETIKGCSSPEEYQSHEEQEANIVENPDNKQLEPAFMRTLCELVRCYEELYG